MDKPVFVQYELEKGGFLYVFNEKTIVFVNSQDDDPKILSAIPAAIVKTLLSKKGEVASYATLFKAAYHTEDLNEKYVNHIQQQVGKLPLPLKKYIIDNHPLEKEAKAQHPDKNKQEDPHPNCGYSLSVKKTTHVYQTLDQSKSALPPAFHHLAGEYIALYPKPNTKKKLLGAVLRICSHGGGLTVNAIFDIPTNKALNRALALLDRKSDFSEIIAQVRKEIPKMNMTNLFIGELKNEEHHLATMTLKSILANDKRNIILNISAFLNDPDRELIEEKDQYRGGLGLVVGGGQTDNGFTAYRIALIRKSWYIPSLMGLDSKEILKHLSATNFVNITNTLDSDFYVSIVVTNDEYYKKLKLQKENQN